MRKVLAVSGLLFTQFLLAQAPTGPRQTAPLEDMNERRMQQDAFEKWALGGGADKNKVETAQESAAAMEFYTKAKQFVDLWEAFAAELNQKKTFNAKLAKQVAKAFHDLEKSDGWPVGHSK